MILSPQTRKTIRFFLEENTTYDVALLMSTKSDNQLYSMYEKIKKAMKSYPEDILEYLSKNPLSTPRYTKEELYTMTYNELSKIRESFSIRATRKKVVKTEQTQGQLQLGIETLLEKPLNKTCEQIITASSPSNESDRDYQILTREEIIASYGEDYSAADLAAKGIISEEAIDNEERLTDEEEERFNMIDTIILAGISIHGRTLDESDLLCFSKEELEVLIKVVGRFTKTNDQKRLKK